jgi:hypothetical protein
MARILSKDQVTPEVMYTTGGIAPHERKKPELSSTLHEKVQLG